MIRLIKTFKNVLVVLYRNPIPCISNRDQLKIRVVWMSAYYDRSTWRSKFNRIRDQIIQHLLNPLWIGVKQWDIGCQLLAQFDTCLERLRSHAINYLPYQTTKLHLLLLNLKLPQI